MGSIMEDPVAYLAYFIRKFKHREVTQEIKRNFKHGFPAFLFINLPTNQNRDAVVHPEVNFITDRE